MIQFDSKFPYCSINNITKHHNCSVNSIKMRINKEIIKQAMTDNQIEIPNYQAIKCDFNFDEFGNFVFVGIRRALELF
jgi:7-cyano-7-deazaguanine synthase in queuosine biosynthesis